jgi:hypothetical protein
MPKNEVRLKPPASRISKFVSLKFYPHMVKYSYLVVDGDSNA